MQHDIFCIVFGLLKCITQFQLIIMKRKSGLISIVFVTLIFVFSGFVSMTNPTIKATPGQPDVKPFHSMSISIAADVDIEQGSPQKMVIDADPADLERIVAEVNNGQLQIRLKSPGDRIKGKVAIHIKVPDLDEISVAGSARVNTKSSFKAGDMTVRISGSGIISFDDLTAQAIEAKISGSGKLFLAGKGQNFDVSLAGSGQVDAYGFQTVMFDGKISGSGNCKVNVSQELGASIAGSGTISYKGNPKVNSTVAGSGSVRIAD
jgi:hypothetical protein